MKKQTVPSQQLSCLTLEQLNYFNRQIGASYLDAIFKKIALRELTDPNFYYFLYENIDNIFPSSVHSNSKDAMILELGQMFSAANFQGLYAIEKLLTRLIQNKFVKEHKNLSVFKTRYINMKAFGEILSEVCKDEDSIGSSKEKQIEEYLQTIKSPRSEINLFCQQMSIPYAEFETTKLKQGIFQVTARLFFAMSKHQEHPILFEGNGSHRILKKSLNLASLDLLKITYKSLPSLWQKFVSIKDTKGFVC